MRRSASWILLLLGAFLATVAVLALVWVPGQVKKTPLDVSSVTRLTGTAKLASGTGLETVNVKATSTTHADSTGSTGDVVLFQNSSCLVKDPNGNAPDCVSADDPQQRLLSASTDTFATNRTSGLAVADFKGLPTEAETKSGLVNKFPFDTQKKTYQFWDGYVSKPIDTTFEGVENIDGLTTYKFHYTITDGDIQITDGVPGKFATDKTMWVEPHTGSIMKQTEHQVRTFADSGATFLDLNFGFTDATIAANVKDGKANASKLTLLTSTVPLVGGILGLAALLAGGALHVVAGRKEDEVAAAPAGPSGQVDLRKS